MRIPHRALPNVRLGFLAAFVGVCALIFGYLWLGSGGRIPAVSKSGYKLSANLPHASNLVYDSDVMIAGIKIGKVSGIEVQGNVAHVTMRLTDNAPIHQGATLRVRSKTLVQETYLELTDGKGAALPDGSSLPDKAVQPFTDLNDILTSVDAPTRASLAQVVRSLGAATTDSRQSISDALTGLGMVGTKGKDALDALAAQSADLRKLTVNASALVAALNTRQGEIASLVTNADVLTKATSGQANDLATAVQRLPQLIDSARSAGTSLATLGTSLAPVAKNLNAAAPDLTAAIKELPATSTDLRGLLPSLNSVLKSAPKTLDLIPTTAKIVEHLIPTLKTDLSDLNPMLGYLEPYGPELAGFFAVWNDALSQGDHLGKLLKVMVTASEQSVKAFPVTTNIGPLNRLNPYPAPGSLNDPKTAFRGAYPHVEREVIK